MDIRETLIDQLYQNVLDGGWDKFLEKTMDATQSNKGFMVLTNKVATQPYLFEIHNQDKVFDEPMMEWASRIDEDPWYLQSLKLNELEILQGSRILPDEKLSDYPIYHELFKPVNARYLLGSIVIRDETFDALFAMNRGFEDSDYDADDRKLMRFLTPHLNRSMKLFSKLQMQNQHNSLYKAVIDGNSNPLLVVDKNMRVLLQNQAADKFLSTNDLFSIVNNKVSCSTITDYTLLKDFVASVYNWLSAGETKPQYISIDKKSQRYFLKAYPIHPNTMFSESYSECCLIEFLLEDGIYWDLVREEYQLPFRELEVLKSIINGLSRKSIALEDVVSENTVKTQITSLFNRLSVNSQTELIALLDNYR